MQKRLFTIKEAAHYTALSRSSLYEAQKRGVLKFTKYRSATRIAQADLDAFLDSQCVPMSAA